MSGHDTIPAVEPGALYVVATPIGHLGDLNEGMCLTAVSLAELSMAAAGVQVRFGSGVAAAQTVYAEPVARAVQRLHAAE